MADVFLSYATEDRERLLSLVRAIEEAGLSLFWDRNVPPGSTWRSVLDGELAKAHCVVVVWSDHSIKSNWVLEEAEEGKKGDRLVPVTIDAVSIPIGFRSVQAANLTGWDGSTRTPDLEKLLASIEHRTAGRVRAFRPSPNPPPPPPWLKWITLGAPTVAAAALLALWLTRAPRGNLTSGDDRSNVRGKATTSTDASSQAPSPSSSGAKETFAVAVKLDVSGAKECPSDFGRPVLELKVKAFDRREESTACQARFDVPAQLRGENAQFSLISDHFQIKPGQHQPALGSEEIVLQICRNKIRLDHYGIERPSCE